MKDQAPLAAEMAEYRRELRAALARELHDGPIQSLTESVMRLEGYRSSSPDPRMQSAISDVEDSVRTALMSLRHLIRELRDEPPNEDMATRVRDMATRYQSSTGVEIAVVISPEWPEVMHAATAVNLFRIVQEAVTNAIRHGHARHMLIELGTTDSKLSVIVSDDGRGFPPETVPGSGLIGIQERAALLGGSLQIRARHPGTEIRVEVPLR